MHSTPNRSRNAELAAAMAKAGLRNYQLADVCHLHTATVSQLLNQRRLPMRDTARTITKILGCPMKSIFPSVLSRRNKTGGI